MKRLYLIILMVVILLPSKVNASEYYGTKYSKSDLKLAQQIYKELNKGKKESIEIKRKSEKKIDSIYSAYIDTYFYLIDDSLCVQLSSDSKYHYIEFYGGKKFKKAKKKQKAEAKTLKRYLKEIEEYEDNILSSVSDGCCQKDWYYNLVEYLINNTYYYDDGLNNEDPCYYHLIRKNGGNVHTFVRNNNGVCIDYANLIKDLCQKKGIDCIILSGFTLSGGAHAWNRIVLDGVSYDVDATWDVCCKAHLYGPGCSKEMFNREHIFREVLQ